MSEITFPPPIEHKMEEFTEFKLKTKPCELYDDESINICDNVQKISSDMIGQLEHFGDDKTSIAEENTDSQDEVNDSFNTNTDTNNSLKSELYF